MSRRPWWVLFMVVAAAAELTTTPASQATDAALSADDTPVAHKKDGGPDTKSSKEEIAPTFGIVPDRLLQGHEHYEEAAKLLDDPTLFGKDTDAVAISEHIYGLMEKAAELGNDQAQHYIARAYLFGDHYDLNVHKAFDYAQQCAAQGNAECQSILGFIYGTGSGRDIEPAKSLVYYTFAAASGDTFAHMVLGHKYRMGQGVKKSCAQAEFHYLEAANAVLEDVEARVGSHIDRVRLQEHDEADEDQHNLLENDQYKLLQYTADRGYVDAQVMLGQMNYMGAGVPVDHELAAAYFEQAAQGGDPGAKAYLAQMHARGDGVKQDNDTSLRLYREAAEGGSALGHNGLGIAYLKGVGVEIDHAKAMQHFMKASAMSMSKSTNSVGVIDAKYHLGYMHYKGLGVPVNYGKAFEFFTAAGQYGHGLAYYYLGLMHHRGEGRQRNCDMAVMYLKGVCERGAYGDHVSEGLDAYVDGHIDRSLINYLWSAEIGMEVAQSNAAYILNLLHARSSPFAHMKTPTWLNEVQTHMLAFLLLTNSGEQGNIESLVRKGDYYYYGRGVAQDYLAAADVYKKAQKLNHPQAMFNLGYMYHYGIGFPQDFSLAKRYYDMAVDASAGSSENPGQAALPVALVKAVLYPMWFYSYVRDFFAGWSTSEHSLKTAMLVVLLAALALLIQIRRMWSQIGTLTNGNDGPDPSFHVPDDGSESTSYLPSSDPLPSEQVFQPVESETLLSPMLDDQRPADDGQSLDDNVQRPADDGQSLVDDDDQKLADDGQSLVDNDQKLADDGQSLVGDGQRLADDDQSFVVNVQRPADDGQSLVDNVQRPADDGQSLVDDDQRQS